MKDYILEIKIKNGLIVNAMRQRGFESVAQLSRACGVPQSKLGNILNLKEPALNNEGEWKLAVIRLCECLNKMPCELFNQQQQESFIKINKVERYISKAEIAYAMQNNKTIDESLDENTTRNIVRAAIEQSLTVREQRIISLRFGIDGEVKTLDEIALEIGVSRERIKQIEAKALRKFRYPPRSKPLLAAIGWDEEKVVVLPTLAEEIDAAEHIRQYNERIEQDRKRDQEEAERRAAFEEKERIAAEVRAEQDFLLKPEKEKIEAILNLPMKGFQKSLKDIDDLIAKAMSIDLSIFSDAYKIEATKAKKATLSWFKEIRADRIKADKEEKRLIAEKIRQSIEREKTDRLLQAKKDRLKREREKLKAQKAKDMQDQIEAAQEAYQFLISNGFADSPAALKLKSTISKESPTQKQKAA